MATLRQELTEWLNYTVYPHLTHERVFGALPGFTQAQSGASWYADCPYCHRKRAFYMLPNREVGQCKSCHRTIGWFGFLRRKLTGEAAAIQHIAALAGIPPLTVGGDEMIPIIPMGPIDISDWSDDAL